MQPTGPFTLTAGRQFSFSPPTGLLNPVAALVYNRSAFDLVFTTPVSKTIPAWNYGLLMPAGSSGLTPAAAAISHVAGVPQLASGASSSGLSSLYIDWLGPDEIPAGGAGGSLGVASLEVSGGTINLAAGTTVDVTGTVDLGSGTTVDVGTVSSIKAGSLTVNNAAGAATGVNVAPKASGFSYVDTTSAVLLGGTTSPAYTVLSVGASNNSGAASQVTFKDTYTGSLLSFILQQGQSLAVPLDFSMQAGSELQFTATQTTLGWVVFG